MNETLPTCPRCGSDAADFQAATVCQDEWHTIPENAAAAAGEKARVEALAAGKTMPEAKAAEVRARRDAEGDQQQEAFQRRDANAAWLRGLLRPETDLEVSALELLVHTEPWMVEALATMLERKLPDFRQGGVVIDPELLEQAHKIVACDVDDDFVRRHLRAYAKDARDTLARVLDAIESGDDQ